MRDLTVALHSAGVTVIVVSARSEACRAETREWLTRHGVPCTELLMATTAESESGVSDTDVKRRIYQEHIAGHWNVLCVFDDRDQVVALWRDLGLLTCQVNRGNF
jgi:hypothetical protein